MFMSWKSEKVSMPMSSAGILGISQGEVLEGIQIDPRAVIIGVIVLVAVIKVLSIFLVPGS